MLHVVHESGSIITAERRHRREFNKSPRDRNLIRMWLKQFSEVVNVKKIKSSGKPKVSNPCADDLRVARAV